MRFLIVLSFLISLFVTAFAQSAYNYHEREGIKRAVELRQLEESGGDEGWQTRIIGGTQVPAESHIAHHAGIIIILTTGWTSVCGGALVSNTRVLTAAHCWYDGRNQARQFTIVLGTTTLFTNGTRLVTTNVVVHPSWNTNTLTHDIAMVVIPAVQYSNTIQPVTLPTLAKMDRDFAGYVAIVSGFGKTSDAQNNIPITTALYQASVTIITNAVCQQSFDFAIHTGHLCTSGGSGTNNVGTCTGDSGGPLTTVVDNIRTLVGIVSFGVSDRCESVYPSVYTRVTAFINWIEANL